MSRDKLPDKVKRIDILRIKYGQRKLCVCPNPHYEIDFENKLVYCKDCQAILDPFIVLCNLAKYYHRIADQVEFLLKQRQEILDWEPHLVALREVERIYRGGRMVPVCPHCGRGILAEELTTEQVGKKHEIERRKFDKEG